MAPKIRVRESNRDEEFGTIRKQIKVSNLPSFESPTKCLKDLDRSIPPTVSINEIARRIYPRTIKSIENGTSKSPRRTIRSKFLPDKLNLTIFDLRFDSIPSRDEIKTLASYWYAASQSTLFLPTVKMGMLKDDNKFSDKKVDQYTRMMQELIEITEGIGNTKAFIGTIPLIPIKYSRRIVRLYLEKGINAFAIDAGTKDFLNHETDFRSILIEINDRVPLDKAFIYACNLGIPRFVQDRARADDFLSLFAYVDAFGSTFKTRGGVTMPQGVGRAKQFLRDQLFYKVSGYREICERLDMKLWEARVFLNDFNQREQLRESDEVRTLIGKEKMRSYLNSKPAVDRIAMKRLGSIATNIKSILRF